MNRLYVWDLPVRLFHWLLAFGIAFAVVAGKLGGNWIVWHGRAGLFILGLVTFRIVWGFVGSATARFSTFVRGPAAIKAYLRGEWKGIGHNPLGALSVLALLALVAVQVGTGLLANDDIAYQGPLADLVGKAQSNALTGIHHLLVNALYAVAALHVAAIVFYVRVKRENLLKPMVTGWKEVNAEGVPEALAVCPHHPSGARRLAAFVAATAIASSTVYAAAGGLLPPTAAPVTAPAATQPAW